MSLHRDRGSLARPSASLAPVRTPTPARHGPHRTSPSYADLMAADAKERPQQELLAALKNQVEQETVLMQHNNEDMQNTDDDDDDEYDESGDESDEEDEGWSDSEAKIQPDDEVFVSFNIPSLEAQETQQGKDDRSLAEEVEESDSNPVQTKAAQDTGEDAQENDPETGNDSNARESNQGAGAGVDAANAQEMKEGDSIVQGEIEEEKKRKNHPKDSDAVEEQEGSSNTDDEEENKTNTMEEEEEQMGNNSAEEAKGDRNKVDACEDQRESSDVEEERRSGDAGEETDKTAQQKTVEAGWRSSWQPGRVPGKSNAAQQLAAAVESDTPPSTEHTELGDSKQAVDDEKGAEDKEDAKSDNKDGGPPTMAELAVVDTSQSGSPFSDTTAPTVVAVSPPPHPRRRRASSGTSRTPPPKPRGPPPPSANKLAKPAVGSFTVLVRRMCERRG